MTGQISMLIPHYERMRAKYPHDKLLLIFDFEGSILDLSSALPGLFIDFDRNMGTQLARRKRLQPYSADGFWLEDILGGYDLSGSERRKLQAWFNSHYQLAGENFGYHRLFEGALEIFRWFQQEQNTYVGVTTRRPAHITSDARDFINIAGKSQGVRLTNDLIAAPSPHPGSSDRYSLASNIHYFQQKGFRVIAAIGAHESDIQDFASLDPCNEIHILPPGPIFADREATGNDSCLQCNGTSGHPHSFEQELPDDIQVAWHRVNDLMNLHNFLSSSVRWAEMDVCSDPFSRDLVLRRESIESTPLQTHEDILLLEVCLYKCRQHERGIKIDFKEGGLLIDRVIEVVEAHGYSEQYLWFNGHVERLQQEGFRKLAAHYPGAVIQSPIHFLEPTFSAAPQKAKEILDMLIDWGVNRFSINWMTPNKRKLLRYLSQWGYEVNIYNVPDQEAFVQAVNLLPRSISTAFSYRRMHVPLV